MTAEAIVPGWPAPAGGQAAGFARVKALVTTRAMGDMTVTAIKENRPYVLPHQEMKAGFQARVQGILDAWSTEPPDPKRLESQKFRGQAFAKIGVGSISKNG